MRWQFEQTRARSSSGFNDAGERKGESGCLGGILALHVVVLAKPLPMLTPLLALGVVTVIARAVVFSVALIIAAVIRGIMLKRIYKDAYDAKRRREQREREGLNGG
jgi:hypothetical protein